jgi:hypothetical protein
MGLAERKAIELVQKLDSLAAEFKDWRDRSEERQPLEKHHFQIRRITDQLNGFRQEIADRLGEVAKHPIKSLAQCRKLELDILDIHRIWHFFRTKLALRTVERFQSYLYAADELAWACYEPAQLKVVPDHIPPEKVKEPPLVFFNGGASPFVSSREQSYEAEPVDGEALSNEALAKVLESLPVPVIGVPWFQIQHLPEALVIGHEIGHTLEDDFELTHRIAALLDDAMQQARLPGARRNMWRAWLGEVFADVVGCLATGPAFTGTLIDFLADDPARITCDRLTERSPGCYPTDYLRVVLSFALLSYQGFSKEAEQLRSEWESTYSKRHAMPEFVPDIPIIVEALVDGAFPEFNGARLSQLLPFGKDEHERAIDDAERMLNRLIPNSDDTRVLFASARLAYQRDPAKYLERDVPGMVLAHIPKKIGVRGEIKWKRADELKALSEHDRLAGARLFDLVTSLRRSGA